MSPRQKLQLKIGLIVASMFATLYLGAMLVVASSGPPHPELHQSDAMHSHLVASTRPMKHLPHPTPWMIRITGWVISVASQFS